MRTGFNLWFKSDIVGKHDLWKHAREHGFAHVEFSIDYPWPWEDLFRKTIAEAINHGFSIGVHLPWRDLSLASPYPELRQASVKIAIKILEYLSKYEIEYAVTHVSSNEWIPEYSMKDYIIKITKDLSPLNRVSMDLGIVLAVENAQRLFSNKPTYLKTLVSYLNAYICLDLGHLSLLEARKGASVTRIVKTINKWVKEVGSFTRVLHVHGYDENKKPHKSIHLLSANIITSYRHVIRELHNQVNNIPVVIEVFYEEEKAKDLFRKLAQDAHSLKEG